MNTVVNESFSMDFEARKTQILDSAIATEAPAPRATLPYVAFEPPRVPAPAEVSIPAPKSEAKVRQSRSRTGPPLGVASMLVVATMMLVASGGMAITALLDLV